MSGNDSSADRPSNGSGHKATSPHDNSQIPKPKRLACMICRRRKLKCDGIKPSCSTCTRLGHNCAYDEVRRKSGPKRGYVKALEERLKQVETLLKTQDPPNTSPDAISNGAAPSRNNAAASNQSAAAAATANFNVTNPSIGVANSRDMDRWNYNGESPHNGSMDDFNNFNANMGGMGGINSVDSNYTWEMIGLGLEEPLPPQETIDELHQIYFEKVHPSIPMIHKYRYLAAMNLAPSQRPPVCLRYAVWTMACAITDKYAGFKDLFYARARKYVEADYVKGFGEHMISVSHAQTHVLLSSYEIRMMYFPRAWMSTGAAVRLCQMIGLHRLDGAGLDVKQCLPPPRDWTEREERRRTFWMAFCEDRYSSIGTGWPMTIDEKDILTNLPSSDEAFDLSRPEQTQPLMESMSPSGAGKLSSFGGIVLMACLFGRNLIHLHRPDVDDRDHDLNGEFWKRHRQMDNIILNTSLCLPHNLKLPAGLGNPNIVFTNMCIHTSTICLHQAAIFKADKNPLPASVGSESKVRCITAANEIASIMRMSSHMDTTAMHPFISFCLYVAARVFVQYLKSRPDDGQTADSLRFLLSAMNALKRRNPLTESFLVQLDVDLEALGIKIPKLKTAFPRSGDSPDARSTQGSRGYHNECHFMKITEDNGNPSDAPEIAEGEAALPDSGAGARQQHQNFGMTSSAGWLSSETQLPSRERSSGPSIVLGDPMPAVTSTMFSTGRREMSGFVQSDSGDTSTTSPEGQSNRPTPNSSTASDRQNMRLNSGSGRDSFETSPVVPDRTPNSQAEASRGMSAFFQGDAGSFGLSGTGLTPDAPQYNMETPNGDFTVPPGWELPGQTGMTPVAEGVLRSIMQMGPMETMDLGWDSNQ